MSSALKVKTSPRPGSRLALEVEIPGGRSQASYEAAVTKLSRSVRLPGFRQGKVPRPVLLQQIGPLRIRATALEDLVDGVWRDALKQEEIAALSNPELSEGFEALLARFSPGETLTVTLELDIQPTPSLRTTKGLVAQAEAILFDPARVDALIEQSRRDLAAMVPVEGRPAASGDLAVVSFSGSYADNGEPILGGSADDLEVELEDGRMIPGFVEGILGMESGETRTIACQFPADYPQEDARGREASFTITLNDLKARELPELDDAFAQQASELPTLAEMRADLEQRLRDDTERRARAGRQDALLKALVEELEVELPETLIQQEIRALIEQTASQVAQQGMDVKSLFTPELVRNLIDSSRPEAEQRLKRGFALQALASAEQIAVEDDEIEAKLKEVRTGLSKNESIDPTRLRGAVAEDLLRNKLLSWLETNSTITESEPEPTQEV
ncbi:trigger factor [Synechococcus sp. CS-1324]|uniref:trigger factor n=1 Tax=Synechococcus sp. CS-1324 TaxID=2847980 RepID=UPI000DB7C3C8|nr:trigger factor [Synechococcus sp. CS-1324]MCT0231110.1 trigger factor [Synechococcus sp. CS-1324]PZV04403.1 MAG: trigger factor [Cyanobium sp.]